MDSTLILNSSSKRYQFLNLVVEKVAVILPTIPEYNQKYIIKNLTTEPLGLILSLTND